MDEKDLEILNSLSSTLNISKTAQTLYITQSAVTKRLQKIEDELGISLFLRTKKGLYPLPVLYSIRPHITQAVDSFEKMRAYSSLMNHEISGTLTLGIAVNYARYRLTPVLKEYMELYPNVKVSIHSNRSNNVYCELMDGSISLGIIRGEYPWRAGDIIISEDQHCLVMKENYTKEQISQLPFLSRTSDSVYSQNLSDWMNETGFRSMKPDIHINDVETIKTMVENGIGWSVLSDICLDNFKGVIQPIKLNNMAFTRKTHILYRYDYISLPQAEAFVKIVLKHENSLARHKENPAADQNTMTTGI